MYANYSHDGKGINLSDSQAHLILSPKLLSLVKQNVSALNGEAGVLDTDPICDCQEYDLKLTKVTIKKMAADQAQANVSFINLGVPTNLKITLIWTSHAWRIDDIFKIGVPSFRNRLEKEIQGNVKI
jgi:hypothetical protein